MLLNARRVLVALLVAAAATLGGLAAGSAAHPHARAGAGAAKAASRPNIVFILTDDLSWDLINKRFAPHIVQLAKRGETFTRYFVADSLCCPSRANIFTGLFPHDTKVLSNMPPNGGFQKFQSEQLGKRTWALALRRRGYRTSMLGKYLNGYGDPMTGATAAIPPGWTDWHVSNSSGYLEFNYVLNDNGKVNSYGGPAGGCGTQGEPDNYGVDVVSQKAQSFIKAAGRKPFVVELATFAPHAPYTPAPRNACDFPGLTAPRDPSFDAQNADPPAWLGQRKPLSPRQLALIDRAFRMRAQSVEAIDRLVADIEAELRARGLARNTYIVFSSDNGYHLGQHRLTRGKQTAFDTDIRVPLIVAGPGVPRGKTVTQVTQSVDLYPTFVELAGGRPSPAVEGRSLVPLLHQRGKRPPRWRTLALVEHHRLNDKLNDPDKDDGRHGGNPTTYEAIRIVARGLPHFVGAVNAVYVEYTDAAHELEYYDVAKDPFERDNIAIRLSRAQRKELHGLLLRLERCHSGRACWSAGRPR